MRRVVPIVLGLAYVLLVFPTGTLPSPRWRPVSTAAIAVTALALIGFIVTPRRVALPAPGGVSLKFANFHFKERHILLVYGVSFRCRIQIS